MAAFLYFSVIRPGMGPKDPTDFSIEGSIPIILKEKGKELWRFRRHFQFKRIEQTSSLPYLVMRDIDGDGSREVLFSTQTQDETREGEVFRFSRGGRKSW